MKKQRWEKLKQALSYPKAWAMMLIYATTLTAWGLALVAVVTDNAFTAFAFTMYALSLLFLSYSVFVTIKMVQTVRGKVLDVADKYAFTRKLHVDYTFRMVFFGACSLVTGLLYVAFVFVTAIRAKTLWYWTLAGYYLLISVVRAIVLWVNASQEKKYKDDFIRLQLEKIKTYRRCGWLFLALAVFLATSVVQMVVSGSRFPSPSGMVYLFGAYAIYRVFISLFNLIKTKKYEDLSASAMQNVNFITATVTLLTFQTVFMDTFASKTAIQIFGGISGFVVCAVVVMFGIYMLVKGKKAQRNMENRLKGLEKN